MRRIKNIEKLTKEDLIIALLKSASSTAEHNFEKLFHNINTNDNTNANDDRVRGKIRDIKIIFNRLENIVTNKNRKEITKKLYEKEKNQNLSDREKEEIYDCLVNLTNTLNNNEKYQCHEISIYGLDPSYFLPAPGLAWQACLKKQM